MNEQRLKLIPGHQPSIKNFKLKPTKPSIKLKNGCGPWIKFLRMLIFRRYNHLPKNVAETLLKTFHKQEEIQNGENPRLQA